MMAWAAEADEIADMFIPTVYFEMTETSTETECTSAVMSLASKLFTRTFMLNSIWELIYENSRDMEPEAIKKQTPDSVFALRKMTLDDVGELIKLKGRVRRQFTFDEQQDTYVERILRAAMTTCHKIDMLFKKEIPKQ